MVSRFTGKTERYVIHEVMEMDIEFMNIAIGEKVEEEKKGPGTEPWGTPVMNGLELECF